MTYLSENAQRLNVRPIVVQNADALLTETAGFNGVCLLILPPNPAAEPINEGLFSYLGEMAEGLGPDAVLITVGDALDLVHAHAGLAAASLQYQLWISIKRAIPLRQASGTALPNYHFGALIHTRHQGSLRHTKTRIQYTYCPACNKTTKDYGGKKHTYNSYGTLMADIWRDVPTDYDGDLTALFERFADLFGLDPYRELLALDCRQLSSPVYSPVVTVRSGPAEPALRYAQQPQLRVEPAADSTVESGRLLLGDCLEQLRTIEDNTIDFAFVDPPYNLGKQYHGYADDLEISEYFDWCDRWIDELARVLRPGRTLALLNIPLWAIRHFLHLEKTLVFQNWIAWEGLSYPVRNIMPSHYAILCFSKGEARPLPGLARDSEDFSPLGISGAFQPMQPLAEWYCLRQWCMTQRQRRHIDDRGPLTDLWWDIHRLKHNSRRVDHPCQLPPQLLYRLISIFTEPGEWVLDCFDGAGTTSLTAHQLRRRYIGIELTEKYHLLARRRHEEIGLGIDPFRKEQRELTVKNSPVERMPKRKYEVPKKTLQLEVRRVAQMLNHLPSREEMELHGRYPIRYYDEYFASWGEVCAAARHDGMSEDRPSAGNGEQIKQLQLFDRGPVDASR